MDNENEKKKEGGIMGGLFGGNKKDKDEGTKNEEEGEKEGGMMGGLFGGNKKDEENDDDKDKEEGGMMGGLFGGKKEEEKKEVEEEKPDPMTKPVEWGNLASNIATKFIELCVMFVIGSRVVFAGKIAQFNVLPTDIECMPYYPTFDDKDSPKFQTDTPEANIDRIYIKSTEGFLTYATKIMFEINKESRKNFILDKIRSIEYDPQVSTPVKYLMVCLTNIFVFFYGIVNVVFGTLNEHVNESLLIFLGPYILTLLFVIALPVSMIASLIITIVNFNWLFQVNMNRDPDYPHSKKIPVWRPVDMFGSIPNLFYSCLYIFFGVLVVFNLSFTPVPILIALFCLLTPLLMSATIIDENAMPDDEKKPYGFLASVQGLLNTKLDLFMLVFSIYVIRLTFKYGNIPSGIMVTLAALYFLYKQYTTPKKIPSLATAKLAGDEQNKKYCPKVRLTKEELADIKRDETELAEKKQEEYDESPVGKADALFQETIQNAAQQQATPQPISTEPEQASASLESESNVSEAKDSGEPAGETNEGETKSDGTEGAEGDKGAEGTEGTETSTETEAGKDLSESLTDGIKSAEAGIESAEKAAEATGKAVEAAGEAAESVGEAAEAVGEAAESVGEVSKDIGESVKSEPDTKPISESGDKPTTEQQDVSPSTESKPDTSSDAKSESLPPTKTDSPLTPSDAKPEPSKAVKKGGSLKKKFAKKFNKALGSLKRRTR